MKRFDFTRFAAMTFGFFALVAAIAAVPVALEHTGNIAADSVRFGMIAVSAVAGALLLPGRATIAMLRWTAIHTGNGPLITACALVMPIPMIVNLLSGLVPYWLGLSVTGCFLAAFVFPARMYRGVVIPPDPSVTSPEAGMLVGRKVRETGFSSGCSLRRACFSSHHSWPTSLHLSRYPRQHGDHLVGRSRCCSPSSQL